MEITLRSFADLTTPELYDVARLRQQVFVVEQECPYPDLDGRDDEPGTVHVLLHRDGALDGYARVLRDPGPPAHHRIGRVLLAVGARGRGLSTPLMEAALAACAHAPDLDVVLDAQSPLAGFYAGFGFVADGAEFLEDGIPHTPMRRPASS